MPVKCNFSLVPKNIVVAELRLKCAQQKLKYAAKLLSESTSKFLEELGKMSKINDWKVTAEFIQISWQWFNVVNSGSLKNNKRMRESLQCIPVAEVGVRKNIRLQSLENEKWNPSIHKKNSSEFHVTKEYFWRRRIRIQHQIHSDKKAQLWCIPEYFWCCESAFLS